MVLCFAHGTSIMHTYDYFKIFAQFPLAMFYISAAKFIWESALNMDLYKAQGFSICLFELFSFASYRRDLLAIWH